MTSNSDSILIDRKYSNNCMTSFKLIFNVKQAYVHYVRFFDLSIISHKLSALVLR